MFASLLPFCPPSCVDIELGRYRKTFLFGRVLMIQSRALACSTPPSSSVVATRSSRPLRNTPRTPPRCLISPMEKYRLVQEHKAEESEDFLGTQTNGTLPEVRITQQGKPRNYISYAMNLFVRPRQYACSRASVCALIISIPTFLLPSIFHCCRSRVR